MCANIRQTVKMGKRTMKIKITTEGLGRMEPILSRFIFVTRDLVKICNFGEFVEIGWPHFKKKVLKKSISNECTRKIELNSIDFKNTIFFKTW